MIRRTRRRRNAVAVALYVNAALVLAVLVALLSRGGGPSISVLPRAFGAEGAQPIAGGGSLYLMPGQMSLNKFGCYVMDTDAQTLCVYRFDGAASKLKLMAARNFRHDRRLGHVNTEPDPKEVEVMVETERGGRKAGAVDGPAPAAPSDAPKSRGNPD